MYKRQWKKYAKKHVSEAHLKKQFELRRKQLDGTYIHVAQILWKKSDQDSLAKAKQIQQQLKDGKLDWADAVKEHSESASAKNGGDLGWIKFSGPMPREFTKVAFEIDAGEFAEPLTSQFGIHLIHCLEIKAGTKKFADVAEELRDAETQRLFDVVAKRQRLKAAIVLVDFEDQVAK